MDSLTYAELIPGSFIINKNNPDWGIGQIQSSMKNIISANFENVGKKVINIEEIKLEIMELK